MSKKTEESEKEENFEIVKTKGGETLIRNVVDSTIRKEVEEIYKHCEILNNPKETDKHDESFLFLLKSARGSEKAKTLTSQLLPRFSKNFPLHTEKVISTYLDLCEDSLVPVRVNAIRSLPTLCVENQKFITHISNVLGQLLDTEDDGIALSTVKKALVSILKINIKDTLASLFQHMNIPIEKIDVEESLALREKCLVFIKENALPLFSSLVRGKEQIEAFVSTQITELMKNCSADEGKEGNLSLLKLIINNSGIDTNSFDIKNLKPLEKLLSLLQMSENIIRRCSGGCDNILTYLICNVLSEFDQFSANLKLRVLRAISELCPMASCREARKGQPIIFNLLEKFLPLPPSEGEANPIFNFSFLELFLYIFHILAKKSPGSLNGICGIKIVTGQPQDDVRNHEDKRQEFVNRLTYLRKQLNLYSKQVLANLNKKVSNDDLTDEEKQKNQVVKKRNLLTLRIINNLIKLAASLCKSKPIFLGPSFTLSSKGKRKKRKNPPSSKQSPNKKKKTQKSEKYVPPQRRNKSSPIKVKFNTKKNRSKKRNKY